MRRSIAVLLLLLVLAVHLPAQSSIPEKPEPLKQRQREMIDLHELNPATGSPALSSAPQLAGESALYQRKPRQPKQRKRQKARVRYALPERVQPTIENSDSRPYGKSTSYRVKSDAALDTESSSLSPDILPLDTARDQVALRQQKNDPNFVDATYDRDSLAGRVVYPRMARENNIQARVVIHARIDTNGKVVETIVANTTFKILEQEAQRAVQATPFSPAQVRGVTVESWVEIPIIFTLAD